MSDKAIVSILVVDDDESFRQVTRHALEARGVTVYDAEGGKEAISILGLKPVNLILSDIRMPEMHGIELLHYCKQHFSKVPMVLMTGFNDVIEVKEAYDIGAKGFLNKPFTTADLEGALTEALKEDFPDINLAEKEKVQKKTLKDATEFCHILIDEFVTGSRIQFPIYLKLSQDKMVKLANHGEDLAKGTVERLKEKGVKYLYLENEDFKKYLHFNTKIMAALSKSKKVDSARKAKFVNQTFKSILKFGVEKTFDKDLAELAKNNIEMVIKLYASEHKTLSVFEQMMNADSDLYEHSVHVSMIATMIARSLGWSSVQKLFMVSTAGLLHDVGKQSMDPDLVKKIPEEMTEEEFEEYQKHSEIGAVFVKSIESFPEGIDQIILHHHERMDGSGFPNGYGRVKIHPVAKIIALADEFCHEWADMIKDPKRALSPRRIMEKLEERRSMFEGDHMRALNLAVSEELKLKKSS